MRLPGLLIKQGPGWRSGAIAPVRLEPGRVNCLRMSNERVTSPNEDWQPDAWSEQRLAVGGRNTRASARRPGGRTGLDRRLDGGGVPLRCGHPKSVTAGRGDPGVGETTLVSPTP